MDHLKKLAAVIVLALTAAGCGPSRLSPDELSEMISTSAEKSRIVIVDIRDPNKYTDGHIKGAVNIPFKSMSFTERIKSLNKDSVVIMCCTKGRKTEMAFSTAEQAGFKKIYLLDGGVRAWKSRGYALEQEPAAKNK